MVKVARGYGCWRAVWMVGVSGCLACACCEGYDRGRYCRDQSDCEQGYNFCFHSFSIGFYAVMKYKSRFLKAVQQVVVRWPSTSASSPGLISQSPAVKNSALCFGEMAREAGESFGFSSSPSEAVGRGCMFASSLDFDILVSQIQ
jgi:hypothetical protein